MDAHVFMSSPAIHPASHSPLSPVCPASQCPLVNAPDRFLSGPYVPKSISLHCLQHLILLTTCLLEHCPCLLGHQSFLVFSDSLAAHAQFSWRAPFPVLLHYLPGGHDRDHLLVSLDTTSLLQLIPLCRVLFPPFPAR